MRHKFLSLHEYLLTQKKFEDKSINQRKSIVGMLEFTNILEHWYFLDIFFSKLESVCIKALLQKIWAKWPWRNKIDFFI